MSPTGARTRTTRAGVERTNHEVTGFQGVVLNSTGAEVQNERREQGGRGGGGWFLPSRQNPAIAIWKILKTSLILTTWLRIADWFLYENVVKKISLKLNFIVSDLGPV